MTQIEGAVRRVATPNVHVGHGDHPRAIARRRLMVTVMSDPYLRINIRELLV